MKDQRRTPWTRIRPATERILDRAFFHVQNVDYPVSLRWVFYRLYQEGLYRSKDDYSKLKDLLSQARHTNFKEWRPDTLADETREVTVRAEGYPDQDTAMENLGPWLKRAAADIPIDHFFRQRNYVELWFEARAMAGQFEHYTKGIDLVPMGGTASIPFKWSLAKRLEAAAERYGKPITVLYFGDEDLSGHTIQRTIEHDVRGWAEKDFKLVWCGLTEAQAREYHVPDSFEGKGYQWESLDDATAKEIITAAVAKYIKPALIDEAELEGQELAGKCGKIIDQVIRKLGGRR